MSFKEYFFKKMIPNYFMIVTLIAIGMAVTGILFYGNRKIDMVTLFVPSVFGALGCLPLLLDFFFETVFGAFCGFCFGDMNPAADYYGVKKRANRQNYQNNM